MRLFKKVAYAAMTKLSGSLTNSVITETPAYGYGYFCAGQLPTAVNTGTIDKLNFNTETCAKIGASIYFRVYCAGVASLIKGYIAGTFSPAMNTVDTITFSNDVAGSLAAVLTTSKSNVAGISSATTGYIGGGANSSDVALNKIDAINFSASTVASIVSVLSAARQRLGSAYNSLSGYFAGGFNVGYSKSAVIDNLIFSTNTVNKLIDTLGIGSTGNTGVSSLSKGFLISENLTTLDSIIFSNNTTITGISSLVGLNKLSGGTNSANAGYWGGGTTSIGKTDKISKIKFSTETTQDISAKLIAARYGLTGISLKL